LSKVVKGMLALTGLILLMAALFVAAGGVTGVIFKEEVEQLDLNAQAAEAEIFEATNIKARVEARLSKDLVTGNSGHKIVVTYEFLPPGVDRDHLYKSAEGPVRKYFQNVMSFRVTNVAAPDPSKQPMPGSTPQPPVAGPGPQPSQGSPQGVPLTDVDKVAKEVARGAPEKKPAAAKGSITLFTIPSGAVVTLKGQAIGTTPLLKVPVPAGTQLFKLAFPDGKTKTLSAKIAAGELAKFKFNQDELPDG
jgi:PEGA domain